MRVLNITFDNLKTPGGGLGVFCRDHGNAMAKKVGVTTVTIDPLLQKSYFESDKEHKVLSCFNTNYQQNPDGTLHLLTLTNVMLENIAEFFGDQKFDIIHNHDSLCWNITRICSHLFKAPTVTTSHLSFGLNHEKGHALTEQQYRWELAQEANAYLKSQAIVTMSENYARRLEEKFFLKEMNKSFDLIPNGVDMAPLEEAAPDWEWRKSVAGEKELVGFIGRMVPSKGVEDFVEAARAFPDKHFVMISHLAPSVEKVYKLVPEMRAAEKELPNLTWLDKVSSDDPVKWNYLKACDVVTMPSKHEPFGIVALELGGLKVPRITTQVDGLVDHCSEEDAVIIEPDAGSLIRAIAEFKRDDAKVEKAYNIAKEHSWDRTADKYLEVYERCLRLGN